MALTRQRGNPFGTRQRLVSVGHATLARREGIPTPARGNEKTISVFLSVISNNI